MSESEQWRELSLCAQVGPGPFFPGEEGSGFSTYAEGRRICAACPVRIPHCLEDAMENETQWRRTGLVAGLSPAERDQLHAERTRQAAAEPARVLIGGAA